MNEFEKLDQIDRLLSAFPAGASAADPEQSTRNYLLAVKHWELCDVTSAVDAFVTGNAPNVHRGFLPSSAELGGECRRQQGLRLRLVDLGHRYHPPLPSPSASHPADSRTRVGAMVARYVEEHRPDANLERDLLFTGPLPPVGGRHVA